MYTHGEKKDFSNNSAAKCPIKMLLVTIDNTVFTRRSCAPV